MTVGDGAYRALRRVGVRGRNEDLVADDGVFPSLIRAACADETALMHAWLSVSPCMAIAVAVFAKCACVGRYKQWHNLAALPSWGLRLRWLWQSVFPPTGYLQELYGPDQGRMALLIERGKRAWQRLTS